MKGVFNGSQNSLEPGIGQEEVIVPVDLSLGEVGIELSTCHRRDLCNTSMLGSTAACLAYWIGFLMK